MFSQENKYPIFVVTGCLGSGKTTMLSKILSEEKMRNSAVLVNEFGSVGLDHHLLRNVEEKTVLMSGGCICCSTREDLEEELTKLLNEADASESKKMDRVIIETTGLADPAPIVFTVLKNPLLKHHFYVAGVVTVVDAVNGLLQLEKQEESVKQITGADKVVLSKLDLASREQIDGLKQRILDINPTVDLIVSPFEKLDAVQIINEERNEGLADYKHLNETSVMAQENPIHSVSLTFDKAINWSAFGLWLSMLLYARGEDILRVKGLIDVGQEGPVVLNGVQHIIHPPQHLSEWPSSDTRSHLIFIMRNVEKQEIIYSLETFQNFIGSGASMLEYANQL